jgi:hypothetical protein
MVRQNNANATVAQRVQVVKEAEIYEINAFEI